MTNVRNHLELIHKVKMIEIFIYFFYSDRLSFFVRTISGYVRINESRSWSNLIYIEYNIDRPSHQPSWSQTKELLLLYTVMTITSATHPRTSRPQEPISVLPRDCSSNPDNANRRITNPVRTIYKVVTYMSHNENLYLYLRTTSGRCNKLKKKKMVKWYTKLIIVVFRLRRK